MIHFDAIEHKFTMGGTTIPSVTQILKSEGWIDDRWYTEDGRKRGTNFHLATEWLDKGILDWTTVDGDNLPRLGQYENAIRELDIKMLKAEVIVHKGKLWAGIVDRFAKFQGEPTVIELKSGQPAIADKLQIIGYGCTQKIMPRLMLLYIKPTRYKMVLLEKAEILELARVWNETVHLYHWRKKWIK